MADGQAVERLGIGLKFAGNRTPDLQQQQAVRCVVGGSRAPPQTEVGADDEGPAEAVVADAQPRLTANLWQRGERKSRRFWLPSVC